MAAQLGEALLLLVSLVLLSNTSANAADFDHFVLFYLASVIAAGVQLVLVELDYAFLKLCRGKRAAETEPNDDADGGAGARSSLQLSMSATAGLQCGPAHGAEDDAL